MPYEQTEVIEVRSWNRTVGAVAEDPRSGFYAFEYDAEWVASGIELSPLRMPLAPAVYVFPELSQLTYQRLPPMLADSLPDRFGNALVTAALVADGIPESAISPLDRLAYTANRGMGALEYRPPLNRRDQHPTAIQLADLVVAARSALHGDFADDASTHDALAQLIQVGTSAGGARPKAVIAFNPSTGQIRSGQLPSTEGFEYWLIKLDGVDENDEFIASQGYGRVEFAYSRMAAAAGIDMMECRLLEESGRAHFMTRRFDRVGSGPDAQKIHVASLCALDHLDFNLQDTHSYAQYLNAVDQLDLGADARSQAFRRCVFNVMAANRDDHTKNVAFCCSEDGTWSLAPAFDVNHSYNPSGVWTQRHQMSVNGKFEHIVEGDVLEMADRFAVPGSRAILREVQSAVDRWAHFAEDAHVDDEHVERIARDIATFRLV